MTGALLGIVLAFTPAPPPALGVTYATVGDATLKMDVYSPEGAGPHPAVVVIHGGAWIGGKREDMTPLAQALAQRGFVAATVSYRLAPKHAWPAMIDDVQTATRFLRGNAIQYRIDPKRVGAAGASAGGHLSLLLGFTDTRDPAPAVFPKESSRVSAVLNLFGPTDLSRDYGPNMDMLFQAVMKKPRAEAATEIREGSPVNHINEKSAPVFTIHGTADPVVPYAQATWLTERLNAAKVPNELVSIEGMKHELPMTDPRVASAMQRGIEFLARRLGAPSALAPTAGSR